MRSRSTATGPGLALGVLACLTSLQLAAADATYKFVTEPTPTNFQGFFPDGPRTERINCASTESFSTWSKWAQCCKTNEACGFISRCSAGVVTEPNGKTGNCPTSLANCYTMTIFASYPYASQSWLQMGCARDFSASKVYREIVPTATPTPSSSSRTSTSTPATTGATEAAATRTDGATPAPEATGTSQAWIAGAVIGAVAAVGIIGFLAFWFGRRRGRKARGTTIASSVGTGGGASTLEVLPPGKLYTPSPDPDRGSYVPVAAAGYPTGQYPPGGYAGGGSPGYGYDQGGMGYDGTGRYSSPPGAGQWAPPPGTGQGFYQPPVEELAVRTPVGKYEPMARSELDGR